MILVDAWAFINDLERCTQDNEICISHGTIDELSALTRDLSQTVGVRDAARKACQWLIANPKAYKLYDPTQHQLDARLTGDYAVAIRLAKVGNADTFVEKSVRSQTYTGWRKITDADEIAVLYGDPSNNAGGFDVNEYAIVENGDAYDVLRWTGKEFAKVGYRAYASDVLGKITAKDAYQKCALDSLAENDITVLYGPAGSGKTLLPLAYVMNRIEKGTIRRCHFVFHYEKLKHARELGFVKGEQIDKLLLSGSLGNILASKLGDESEVRAMLKDGTIDIIPTSSIRGFEAGENDMIFCTEAQNLDPYTVRTIIQRAKTGCKIVLEGDALEQTDIARESGLGKVIDVFKGQPYFGCVKLMNNYRSGYGALAEQIR